MSTDVIELREFYDSQLGEAAAHSVSMSLSAIWGKVGSERLLGMGYPVPWIDRFCQDSERTAIFMPAAQGAVHWPVSGPSATALVFDEELPLADSSVDRILMAHFLEHAENAGECLAEAWRVLSPGGKLIIVVPNRRGVWARFEHTPFGTGRPYSRGQLDKLLRDSQLSPEQWSDALHFPPSTREFMLRIRPGMERFGRRIWPVFSGVIAVLATKRVFQGVPASVKARRKVFVPVLAPQGTGRTLSRHRQDIA